MPSLELNSLSKWYGRIRGAEAISFAVEPGEIFGYLGPNGAGKTTTLRCALGLLRPSSGAVKIFGESVRTGKATAHARVGYLPGEFRIWRGMRAGYALDILGRIGSADKTKARRAALAERLDLDLERKIGELSKGNRQKVAVIFAFQHEPDLLILDEPTSGLDPLVRQIVLELMREAAAAGAAVLLSSHDLSEVSATCRRVGIVREGRLVEVAPLHQLLKAELHRLSVWFEPGFLPPRNSQPGAVRVLKEEPGWLEIAYYGSADPVLKWLALFPVERMVTPQASLEESFIEYYRMPKPVLPAAPKRPEEGPA